MALRRIARWASRTSPNPSPRPRASAVDDSTSVKRKVTVPVGSSTSPSLGAAPPIVGSRPRAYHRTVGLRLKRGEPEQVDRLRELNEAFRPAAPIDRGALFSGRTAQLGELISVADQP